MDPISRRDVWTLIQGLKTGVVARSVVLTTHSMEEADTLSDTIAIMALGRLRCIGNNVHLKQKFGAGYTLTVRVGETDKDSGLAQVDPGQLKLVSAAVAETLGLGEPVIAGSHAAYRVPHGREQVSDCAGGLSATGPRGAVLRAGQGGGAACPCRGSDDSTCSATPAARHSRVDT